MALGLADREGKREFGVILFHDFRLHASNLCLELGGVAVGQGPTADVDPGVTLCTLSNPPGNGRKKRKENSLNEAPKWNVRRFLGISIIRELLRSLAKRLFGRRVVRKSMSSLLSQSPKMGLARGKS